MLIGERGGGEKGNRVGRGGEWMDGNVGLEITKSRKS